MSKANQRELERRTNRYTRARAGEPRRVHRQPTTHACPCVSVAFLDSCVFALRSDRPRPGAGTGAKRSTNKPWLLKSRHHHGWLQEAVGPVEVFEPVPDRPLQTQRFLRHGPFEAHVLGMSCIVLTTVLCSSSRLLDLCMSFWQRHGATSTPRTAPGAETPAPERPLMRKRRPANGLVYIQSCGNETRKFRDTETQTVGNRNEKDEACKPKCYGRKTCKKGGPRQVWHTRVI